MLRALNRIAEAYPDAMLRAVVDDVSVQVINKRRLVAHRAACAIDELCGEMETGMGLMLNKGKSKILATDPLVAESVRRKVRRRGFACSRGCRQLGIGYSAGGKRFRAVTMKRITNVCQRRYAYRLLRKAGAPVGGL
eukprot:12309747-Karenia_brevis.AAC.1